MLRLSRNAGTAALIITALGLLVISVAIHVRNKVEPAYAPDITLPTITGEKISLQQLRGRPVLINFWATSCARCVHELPHLAELYREATSYALEIIAIAMPYDRPDHVMAMSKSQQIPYPVALDISGTATQAFGDVRMTPTVFLIAPDGRIVHRATGSLDKEKLTTMIKMMPAHKPSTAPNDPAAA